MDSASAPLADYFWIAGVESISYNDPAPPQPATQLDTTISEDAEADNGEGLATGPGKATARHSRHSSINRLSRISGDNRLSIVALEELDIGTRSNRSSTTIRASKANGHGQAEGGDGGHVHNGNGGAGGHMPDFDFDKALVKFAAERENFLDDLSFSAGAKLQSRPPMVGPRAERIKATEGDVSGRMSPLRSIRGSIRRKMSFREFNSARKQPSAPKPGKQPPGPLPLYLWTTLMARGDKMQ